MAAILGFLTGLLVMHFCSRKKAIYSLAANGQANVRPTAQPAGPVYEEVSPKEEMEMKTNQAYGTSRTVNHAFVSHPMYIVRIHV